MGNEVQSIYAWVTLDDGDGNEGVLGFRTKDGWMPAIGADRDRVESLRFVCLEAIAAGHANAIELRRFSTMEVLETIDPPR
jgi:hypothetical protein